MGLDCPAMPPKRIPLSPAKGKRKKKSASSPDTRATRLSDDLTKRFCRLIRRGVSPTAACDYLGISTNSYWTWMQRGEKHIKDLEDGSPDKPDSHDKLCGEFVRRYRKAMAKHNIDRTDALHRRGNRQWYRELAILERRDRRTWGRYEPKGGSDEAFDPDDRFL